MKPVYSVVVPIYNEEAVPPILLRRLDALRDQLNFVSVMMGIIGLAIAAGPIVAKFIR